jgi:ribulose-5-phosphate 4-epimerase/fuculose-1-phosphate aldolase
VDDGTTRLKPNSLEQRGLRIDLAAAFRMAARFEWQEAVANHFSMLASADARFFLINPRWSDFAAIRASDLLLIDGAASEATVPPAIDRTAWAIHRAIHAALPHARCILHAHPPYATALSCLADCEIKPIDQTTARFFRRVSIDSTYGGIADNAEEGRRLARSLGERRLLLMGNHGAIAVGETVAEAFDALYYLERACRTLILAYSTGQRLSMLSDEVAERTARAWEDGGAFARAHFEQVRRRLDLEEPSYAQ